MSPELPKKSGKFISPAKSRVLLLVASGLMLLSAVFFDWQSVPTLRYEVGSIVQEDITAPFDLVLKGEVDEGATARLKEEALSRVRPVYRIEERVEEGAFRRLRAFFAEIKELKERTERGEGSVEEAVSSLPLKVSVSALRGLLSLDDLQEFSNRTEEIVKQAFAAGIFSAAEAHVLESEGRERIVIRRKTKEEEKATGEILNLSGIEEKVEALADVRFPRDRRMRILARELAMEVLNSNLILDPEETRIRQENALAEVIPEYRKVRFRKGEIVVAKDAVLDTVQLNYLKQLNEISRVETTAPVRAGILGSVLILSIVLLTITVLYLKNYEPQIFSRNQDLFLIVILTALLLAAAKWLDLGGYPGYLVPVAAVSMLLAILLCPRVALMLTVVLSVVVSVIFGSRLEMMVMFLTGGVVGIYSVLQLRRRSQFLLAGALVGLTNFVCIVSLEVIARRGVNFLLLNRGGWGLLNGFIAAAVTVLALPLFEYLFKITNNIRLLELSDLNHPLLKELVTKALGTYHHSLVVGNLAAAACEAIGANSLLARVGAYYHDIGKIIKPGYFSENQEKEKSEHEKLSPQMSRLIILNHVKEGGELARKHKLNQAIVDIVEQHHGTSLMHFFYHRALEGSNGEDKIDEAGFRYPGPKPQSKEGAIVLLADSVEAAARTLDEPTPSRVEDLVKEIVNNKFIDGQLDECDLSLKNLHLITESFTRVLGGIYHWRVRYPKLDEEREKKTEAANKGENRKSDQAGGGNKSGNG